MGVVNDLMHGILFLYNIWLTSRPDDKIHH